MTPAAATRTSTSPARAARGCRRRRGRARPGRRTRGMRDGLHAATVCRWACGPSPRCALRGGRRRGPGCRSGPAAAAMGPRRSGLLPTGAGCRHYGGSVLLTATDGSHHVDRTPHRAQGNRRRRGRSRARGTVPGPRRRTRGRARRPGVPGAAGRSPTSATASCACTCPRASATGRSTTPTTPVVLDDGTVLPGRHDGMAAFAGEDGRVTLVRNHEVNAPGPAFGPLGDHTYDPMAQGGCTVIDTTLTGEVEEAWTGINGTQMNCSGGPMPWGTWITCEETVNGPDVGADFTDVSNVPLTQPHGFIFEVPTTGRSDAEPVTNAGRFAHESVAFDPRGGSLYLSEDNFGFPSGFYRYTPRTSPMETGQPGQRRPPPDAQGQGSRRGPPRGVAGQGRPLPRRVGRHRRPGTVLPLHPGPARPDDEQRRAGVRRRPGTRARAPRTSHGSRGRSTTTGSSTSPRPRAVARR